MTGQADPPLSRSGAAPEDRVRVFVDGAMTPHHEGPPPCGFPLDTRGLEDGPHVLRIEAPDGLRPPKVVEFPFRVRNGVAVSLVGLDPGEEVSGALHLIVNADRAGLEFHPTTAETPQPAPTWAWLLLLCLALWGAGYALRETSGRGRVEPVPVADRTLRGARLFADLCAKCHGEDGRGLASIGVFKKPVGCSRALEGTWLALAEKIAKGGNSEDPGSATEIVMPSFRDRLSPAEIQDVAAWVWTRTRAWQERAAEDKPR